DKLHPVFHGETGNRALKELARSYLALTRDTTRVMNRLKALYRSWAIPCAGDKVYSPRHRNTWLEKLSEAGVRRRAEQLYQQLDALVQIRREARRELLAEKCHAHPSGPARTRLLSNVIMIDDYHGFLQAWQSVRDVAGL